MKFFDKTDEWFLDKTDWITDSLMKGLQWSFETIRWNPSLLKGLAAFALVWIIGFLLILFLILAVVLDATRNLIELAIVNPIRSWL